MLESSSLASTKRGMKTHSLDFGGMMWFASGI